MCSSPREFLAATLDFQSPLQTSVPQIELSLRKAVLNRANFGSDSQALYDLRQGVWDQIYQRSMSLRRDQQRWATSLPPDMHRHAHLHQPFISYLAEVSGSPDLHFADDLTFGLGLFGELRPCGWWNKGFTPGDPVPEPHVLFQEAAARRQRGEIPTSTQFLPELWEGLLAECDRGWWTQPVPIEQVQGDFVSSLYFGKLEGNATDTKVRGIMDPYPNAVDFERENMRLDGVEGFFAMLQYIQDAWTTASDPKLRLGFAKEDWTKGFKQMALRPDQRRLYGIHLKHWQTGQIMVLFPNVIPFGPRKGPLQFSRGPLLICHVLRTLFYIPAYAHIDDIVVVEQMGYLGDQAHDITIKLHQLCGWELNEAKRVPRGQPSLTTEGVVLGLYVTCLEDSSAIARISLDEAKATKYISCITDVLTAQRFHCGEAAKIGGQANYAQSHLWKRSARMLIWPIYERSRSHGKADVTDHIEWCLRGLRQLYLRGQSRLLKPLCSPAPHAVIYTDARGNSDQAWGTEFLGGLLHISGTYHFFMVPVTELCEGYLTTSSQHRINQCEAIAELVAISTWSRVLAGLWVTIFIDNSAAEGVASCLVDFGACRRSYFWFNPPF